MRYVCGSHLQHTSRAQAYLLNYMLPEAEILLWHRLMYTSMLIESQICSSSVEGDRQEANISRAIYDK